ncbi:MAG: GntR family transcriptional regulator [Sarcina sp.]
MDIIITNSAGVPIYEQISSQIKTMIMKGKLLEGEALPSMRALAKDLRISVITTKRAYSDLERDGFIESITGKGSFVAKKNLEIIKEEQLRQIEENLEKIVDIAKENDINCNQLIEMLELIYKGE